VPAAAPAVVDRNAELIVQLEMKFFSSPNFRKPGRFILREGELLKKGREMGSQKDAWYQFYLFNDLLAYAEQLPVVGLMKLHGELPIVAGAFFVRRLPPSHEKMPRLLIASTVKTLVLCAKDTDHCERWAKQLEWCVTEARKKSPLAARAALQPLPVWLDPSEVPDVDEMYPGLGGRTIPAPSSTGSGAGLGSSMSTSAAAKVTGVESRAPTRDALAAVGVLRTVNDGTESTAPRVALPPDLKANRDSSAAAGRLSPPPSGPAPAVPSLATAKVATFSGPKFCSVCGADRCGPDWFFCDRCGAKYAL
jgi:hypothetical protein